MNNMFEGLERNGSGCIDLTAYHAIINAALDESRIDKKIDYFVNDLYEVCKKHNIFINGDVDIRFKKDNKNRKIKLDNRYYIKKEK